MKALLNSIWQANASDSNVAIRGIVSLRIGVLAITAVFLVCWHLFATPLPQWQTPLLTLSIATAWSALVLLRQPLQSTRHAQLREILIDVIWVFVIVLFAGRTTNPFIYYCLVLTAFAATLLNTRQAWLICAACVALYSALLLFDVRIHFEHFSSDYKIHLVGMWVNYVGSSVLICFFVTHLMQALREQQQRITIIRENNLKNEQLIGLATVSATTIHNLATPLSTLNMLIDSFAENAEAKTTTKDLNLMREQIKRCKATMEELSILAQKSDAESAITVNGFIELLQSHYALHFPEQSPRFAHKLTAPRYLHCSPLFQYAIINLIDNAMESSEQPAAITFEDAANTLTITISNQYAESVDALFERWGRLSSSEKSTGLGIGSMLANSTIERLGGTVKLAVAPTATTSGLKTITVTVTFPLEAKDSHG